MRPFRAPALFAGTGASFPSDDWRSWYSWKHGTMHKFVWHSGQWYFVLRRKIRPWASIVFQQKLQPSAGPGRSVGQWLDRVAVSNERSFLVEACWEGNSAIFFNTIWGFAHQGRRNGSLQFFRLYANRWQLKMVLGLFLMRGYLSAVLNIIHRISWNVRNDDNCRTAHLRHLRLVATSQFHFGDGVVRHGVTPNRLVMLKLKQLSAGGYVLCVYRADDCLRLRQCLCWIGELASEGVRSTWRLTRQQRVRMLFHQIGWMRWNGQKVLPGNWRHRAEPRGHRRRFRCVTLHSRSRWWHS